jgi:hypothetical protein
MRSEIIYRVVEQLIADIEVCRALHLVILTKFAHLGRNHGVLTACVCAPNDMYQSILPLTTEVVVVGEGEITTTFDITVKKDIQTIAGVKYVLSSPGATNLKHSCRSLMLA